jgi:hypothetical protein
MGSRPVALDARREETAEGKTFWMFCNGHLGFKMYSEAQVRQGKGLTYKPQLVVFVYLMQRLRMGLRMCPATQVRHTLALL